MCAAPSPVDPPSSPPRPANPGSAGGPVQCLLLEERQVLRAFVRSLLHFAPQRIAPTHALPLPLPDIAPVHAQWRGRMRRRRVLAPVDLRAGADKESLQKGERAPD